MISKVQLNRQRNESKMLIEEVFGHESLENNLDLENLIKYNQFCRIKRKITIKERLVKRHLRENIGNFLASIVGPLLFWYNLEYSENVYMISRFLFFVKIAQVIGKTLFCHVMWEQFLKPKN